MSADLRSVLVQTSPKMQQKRTHKSRDILTESRGISEVRLRNTNPDATK